MLNQTLVYLHVMSLAMWFGGLFGYVLIVWPTLLHTAAPGFPRQVLVTIGMRTAPWIYLAMGTALVTFFAYWFAGLGDVPAWCYWLYLVVLGLLAANNVYGSTVAWPRIMLFPEAAARRSWRAFYWRMAISLGVGLAALSVCVVWL